MRRSGNDPIVAGFRIVESALSGLDSHEAMPLFGTVMGTEGGTSVVSHPVANEVAWGSDANRTVLVLASRFPPAASVGAIRVRKFVKYLGQFGWRPIVITGAARRCQVHSGDPRRVADEDSLLDLPAGLPVHRLSPVLDDWPGYFSRAGAVRLARLTRWMRQDARSWRSRLRWRLQRVHDRFGFPDRGIWRLPSAVRLARRLHREYNFDCIFSTGMPFSDHMIAMMIQRTLKRPWIADFRDPWVEYIHWRQWQSDWGRRLTRKAESAVVRRAAAVVSVNDHMTERFRTRYPRANANKFITIENGFDPSDFPPVDQRTPNGQFRLLYAGSLYKTRSPKHVLEAFRKFIRSEPASRRRVCFEFIGRPGPEFEALLEPSDAETIRHAGMHSHHSAARAMSEADLNVVLLPDLPGGVNDTTTKVYECLGSNQQILAAVPLDGSAARLLRRFGGVHLCAPDDVDGMARAMADRYHCWLAGESDSPRSPELLLPLTRRFQTGRLAETFEKFASAQSPARRTAGDLGQVRTAL